MSSREGLARTDTSTSLYEDPKVKRLWRSIRDEPRMCRAMVLYEATRLMSAREAERVAAEDAAPDWMSDPAEAIRDLTDVGLLDAEGRLPEGTYGKWIGEQVDRANETRRAWAERKRAQRDRERGSRGSGDDVPQDKAPVSPPRHRDKGGVTASQPSHPPNLPSSPGQDAPPWEATTRKAALSIPCPTCPAGPGQPCEGVRPERNGDPWRRFALHIDRWHAAVAGETPDILDAWTRLTASVPRGRTLSWLGELAETYGDEDASRALAKAWQESNDIRSVISRAEGMLVKRGFRTERQERKAQDDERRKAQEEREAQQRREDEERRARIEAMPPEERAANMARLRDMIGGATKPMPGTRRERNG